MAISDFFGVQGMNEEDQKWMKNQQLMSLAASLLQSSAPSTDPRNGSLAYALGQGMQNMQASRGSQLQSLAGQYQLSQAAKEREKQGRLEAATGAIPLMENVTVPEQRQGFDEFPSPLRPGATIPGQNPRDLSAIMGDYARAHLKVGDVEGAAKMATVQGSLKKQDSDAPYKKGSLHEIYEGGKKYQATFAGSDNNGNPIFTNKQEITPQEPLDNTDIRKFETVTGFNSALRGTPAYQKAFLEWNEKLQSVNRPRFIEFTDKTGQQLKMVNVNDPMAKAEAEANGFIPGKPSNMSAGTKDDIAGTKDLQKIMAEMESTYDPNYTGKWDALTGWASGATDIGVDPKEQKFRTLTQSLMNITGKLRAGSAWTQPEIDRLEQELATLSQGDTKFKEAFNWAKQAAKNKLENIENVARDTRTYYNPGVTKPKEKPSMAW